MVIRVGPSSPPSVQCPFRPAAMSAAKPPKLRPPRSPAKIQSDSPATPPPAIPAIEVGNPARLAGPLHGEGRPQCTNGEDVACSSDAGCEGGEGGRTPAAEVVSILAGSRLGAAEPRLSEEQWRINDQLQADELMAMEAIYGDDIVILEKMEGLRMIQINIVDEVPNNYNVSSEHRLFADKSMKPDGASSSNSDNSDEFLYRFNVQYLPPICLTCLLPLSYPSHSSPYFTIYAFWLSPSRISILCRMLDAIWLEHSGQEVLYQWAEWLHLSALPYLNSSGEVCVGPYGTSDDDDRRAVSGSVSPDADIANMIVFSDKKVSKNFLKSMHDCSICFSEYTGMDFVQLPCKHYFCQKCMETYVDIHVKEGSVHQLICPDNECNELLPPGILKILLGKDAFERWESLLLRKTLDSMVDIVYCPRCETPCLEEEGQDAQCTKCFFSFCILCKGRRHVGVECVTSDAMLKFLQARQELSFLQEAQRRKELDIINNILSTREILRDAKQCPNCKMAISRIEGCNKMTCENCYQYFCYKCSKAIDGYDHFRNGKCQLFPPEAIEEWERQQRVT